jgi:branched-chain amino acid transport system substrate-binding protein
MRKVIINSDACGKPLFHNRFAALAVLVLALSAPACVGSADKKAIEEEKSKFAAPVEGVSDKKTQREKEFLADLKNPLKSPVADKAGEEKAAPTVGFGKKTEIEMQRERPRAAKIGVLAPISGELQFFGTEAMNGAELASEELDAAGGIKGQMYEMMVYDTKGSVGETQKGVDAFLDQKTLAVVGAGTGEVSFSATKIINDNQLILVSAGSRRRLGDSGPYNFRITLDDDPAIKGLLDYIVANKKWKNFALFSSLVNDYSVRLNATFKSEIINHKLNVSHELYLWAKGTSNVAEEDMSIAAQLTKLKKNPPDALVYTGDAEEAKSLVDEMRKQGINIPIIGGEDIMAPEFTALGQKAVGTLVYGGFNPDSSNPKVRKFVESYKKHYGKEPSRLSALAYDAFNMIVEGAKAAPSLRPSYVRDALNATKGFEGVTGKITFTPNREAIKEPFIFEMGKKDGKYKFICVKDAT